MGRMAAEVEVSLQPSGSFNPENKDMLYFKLTYILDSSAGKAVTWTTAVPLPVGA
jgi:hypothetical protein